MNEKSVWNAQNIIDNSNNWTLACDEELLKYLKDLSQKLIQRSQSALNSLTSLKNDVNNVCISVANTDNRLRALSDTQFIESKVQDDMEMENSEQKDERNEKPNNDLSKEVKLKKALEIGMNVLRTEYDIITVTDSDSENDEDVPNVLLKSRNPYMNRKLPFTIGSDDFTLHDHVGIISSSDEDDEEIEVESKEEESFVNEYRPNENNIEISKLPPTLNVEELSSLSNSVSSLESGSSERKTNFTNMSESISTNVRDTIQPYIDDIFSPPPFPEHETNESDSMDDDEYDNDIFSIANKPNIPNSISETTEEIIKSELDDCVHQENLLDNNDSTNVAGKIKEEIMHKNVNHKNVNPTGAVLPKPISQLAKHGMFDALNKELANKLKIPAKPNLTSTTNESDDCNKSYISKCGTDPLISNKNKNEKPADTPNSSSITTSKSIKPNLDNSKVQKSSLTDLFGEDENLEKLLKTPIAEKEIARKEKTNVSRVSMTKQLDGNHLDSTDLKKVSLISTSKKTETIKKTNLFDDESDSEDDIFNIIKNQKVNLNDNPSDIFNAGFSYEKSHDKSGTSKSISFFEDTSNDVESFNDKLAASFDHNKPKSSYLFNSDSDDSISELLGKQKKESVIFTNDADLPENNKITSTHLFQTNSKEDQQNIDDELQISSQLKSGTQSAKNVVVDNSFSEVGNYEKYSTKYNAEIVSSSSKLFDEHECEPSLNTSDVKESNRSFDKKLSMNVETADDYLFTKNNRTTTAENADIRSNSEVNSENEILNDVCLKHNDVKSKDGKLQPFLSCDSLPEEKIKNIPGKLTPGRGLNINVNALLPKMRNTINKKVTIEQPEPVSTPPSDSVDAESNRTTVLPNIIKDRAKIMSKRRPQTRSSRIQNATQNQNNVFSNKDNQIPIDSNQQDLKKIKSIDEQTKVSDIFSVFGKSPPLQSNLNESCVKCDQVGGDIFETGANAFNVATNLGNNLISASGSREPPPSDLNFLSDDDDNFFGDTFNREFNSDNFNDVSEIKRELSLDAPEPIFIPTTINIEHTEEQRVDIQATSVIVNDDSKSKNPEMYVDELNSDQNKTFSSLDNPPNEPEMKCVMNTSESSMNNAGKQKKESIKGSKFKIDDIFASDSDDDIFSNTGRKMDSKFLKDGGHKSVQNTLSNTKTVRITASNSILKNDKVGNLFGDDGDDDDDLFKKPMKKHFIKGASKTSKMIFDNDDDDGDDLFGRKAN